MKTAFFTTPIYYVNGSPHIGHYYTSLLADSLIRQSILNNTNTIFSTGTDEHGLKISQTAQKQNKTPIDICNINSEKFKQMNTDFNFVFCYDKIDAESLFYQSQQNSFFQGDAFIRTTDEYHKKHVQDVWMTLFNNGWLYKGFYEGWYSIAEECYFEEKELIDGKTPTGYDVVWKKEETYFFKLSLFQNVLLDIFEKQNIIEPYNMKNEILAFTKNGLKDLSISRQKTQDFSWGIDVPNDNTHVIYVWLDALFNYISVLKNNYETFWVKNVNQQGAFHLVGKDIIRFHTIFWFAFLLGLNYKNNDDKCFLLQHDNYSTATLPYKVFGHGWWTAGNKKISKTFGNVIDPYEEIQFLKSCNIDHETALDYFRFALLHAIPLGNDGNYTRENMIENVNAHIVNNIGNLYYRASSMLKKVSTFQHELNPIDTEFLQSVNKKITELTSQINHNYDPKYFIDNIMIICNTANVHFANQEPWKMTLEKDVESLLFVILETVGKCAIIMRSFCPYIMDQMLNILNIEYEKRNFHSLSQELVKLDKINKDNIRIITPKINTTE